MEQKRTTLLKSSLAYLVFPKEEFLFFKIGPKREARVSRTAIS